MSARCAKPCEVSRMSEMACRTEMGVYRCIEHDGSLMVYPDQHCERARIEAALQHLQWACCKERGCRNPSCIAVHDATAILRGES